MDRTTNAVGRVDLGSRSKSEVITLRINPKLKFGLELTSRLHNRSVAQTVELAIMRILEDPYERASRFQDVTLEDDIIDSLWSPHRGERLLKMMLTHPELVSYEEEVLWNKMARAGLLDSYFERPAEPSKKPLPSYNRLELEDRIARFWDEMDAAEKAEAEKKKKEKAKGPQ